jgi:hypothetical protein
LHKIASRGLHKTIFAYSGYMSFKNYSAFHRFRQDKFAYNLATQV